MQPNDKALYVILKSPITPKGEGVQLALHVQLQPATREGSKECLCFYDTERGHMINGAMEKTEEHSFTFRDSWRDEAWEFREVTIQEYRHRLAEHVASGKAIAAALKTTENLWEWYRQNYPI